jgi:diacylglycerol kinase (ATP)
MKKLHIIVNPAAGQDRPFLGMFNKVFKEASIEWDIFVTKDAGDAYRFAKEAVEAGADCVAAFGGDGTVMEAANGLMGTEIPLAIFPGGTANVMSVELGIPSDLAMAAALIGSEDSTIRLVDVGQIRDKYFLLRAGIGWEADVVEAADRDLKDRMGPLAYIVSGFNTLRQPTTAKYHLTIDGEEIETEGITCMVTNAGSLGRAGLRLAPKIDVSDGLLDILVIRNADVGSLITLAASVLTQNENESVVQHWQAKEVVVISDPEQSVQVDGEMLEPGPVTIRVLPQALRVIVPKTATAATELPQAPEEAEAEQSAQIEQQAAERTE